MIMLPVLDLRLIEIPADFSIIYMLAVLLSLNSLYLVCRPSSVFLIQAKFPLIFL